MVPLNEQAALVRCCDKG